VTLLEPVAPAPLTRPRPSARPNHLRVVPPTERPRRRLTPRAAVALTGAVFATLLAVAVAQTVLVSAQVRLDRLDSELAAEQARYQQLRKDVATLESPARIVDAAHAQGMVSPLDLVYLQPPAMEPTAPHGDAGDAGTASEASVGAPPDRPWSDVKPLLEAPAP
jgi:cell division protein FtsL